MAIEDVLPTLILVAILYAVYRWLSGPSEYHVLQRGVRIQCIACVRHRIEAPILSIIITCFLSPLLQLTTVCSPTPRPAGVSYLSSAPVDER